MAGASFGDYAGARERFCRAAKSADARLTTIAHGGRGPQGEPLLTDVARLGAESTEDVVVYDLDQSVTNTLLLKKRR